MGLKVGGSKDNIYVILPESRYAVSNRIDSYMEEDFTLYTKAKVNADYIKQDTESFLISRNGMHSGISFYKDKNEDICVCFTYWFTTKNGESIIKQVTHIIPESKINDSNEYKMICDHYVDRNISCYFNNEMIGKIEFGDSNRNSYLNGFYWIGCGSMIGPEEHQCIGEFDVDLMYLLNTAISVEEMDDLATNYNKHTYDVFDNLKKFKDNFYLKKYMAFFCNFDKRNRYKVWDMAFNGNYPQIYLDGNIYF
jgi:hypothetical protein